MGTPTKTIDELGLYTGNVCPQCIREHAEKVCKRVGTVTMSDHAWLWGLARITWPDDEVIERRKR